MSELVDADIEMIYEAECCQQQSLGILKYSCNPQLMTRLSTKEYSKLEVALSALTKATKRTLNEADRLHRHYLDALDYPEGK